MKALLLIALLASLPALAEDAQILALLAQGDTAEARQDTRGALALFRQAEQLAPENVAVLLRISKQYSDLVGQTQPPEAALRIAERALDFAKRIVALDGKSAKARLNLAICYGRLTDFVGNKTKLEYSRIVKSEVSQSLELDPTDDFAWHVLGRWHFSVANVNGMLKTMARLIYGGLPAASNEEAARCLKKAVALAPQRLLHHAELAHVHTAMGQTEFALQEWQNVLGIRAAGVADAKYQQEARAALEAARPKRPGRESKMTTQR